MKTYVNLDIKGIGTLIVTALLLFVGVAIVVTLGSPVLTAIFPGIFTGTLAVTDALLFMILLALTRKT